MSMKRVFFASALIFSATAFAQQADISGKDFLSGAGDARLESIAKQAAAEGKKLVVTAPTYWQGKVASKLHAGAANVEVSMNEGFFENVLVRIEDNKPVAKAEPPKADAARAEGRKADAVKTESAKAEVAAKTEAKHAEAARAEAARIAAAKAAADRAAAEKAAAERAAAARASAAEAAAAKIAAAKAAAAKAATDAIAATKAGMEKNLNNGSPAAGNLSAAQLKAGDVVYVDGSVRGVVRRTSTRLTLYWLDGPLDLDRIELMPDSAGRYKVIRPLDMNAAPVLRSRSGGHFIAAVPPAGSTERNSLVRQFAEGRDVTGSLSPTDLRHGDLIYMAGTSAALVVRRGSTGFSRYWLEGDLNLGQTGLIKQGDNVYRVLSDTIK